MNRGSISAALSPYPGLNRFNEAPIHESGKCPPTALEPGALTSFNEAPIHESGKYASELEKARAEIGFNEAPIHESGKCVQGGGHEGDG